MTAVLLIGTIGVLALGFIIARRFGSFLDAGGCSRMPDSPHSVRVLLFAPDALRAALLLRLDAQSLSVSAPVRNELPEGVRFSVLLALTSSDFENLRLCSAARRLCPGGAVVACCRDPLFFHLYKSVGADHVLPADCTPEEVLASMKGLLPDDSF
ncbi:MAG: NAD-binding protein [Clostridiaceae bacterium]|nr:NAD-binding protein [Clostridiaceae bacterium]